jgi:pyruvate dehydrogenase E1 component alpha subunit
MKNQVKDLSNPEKFQSPINISNVDVDVLMLLLESMTTIRKTEQQLALGRKSGLIGGPVHLGAGQEAIAVGISQYLKCTDRVFGGHRSHSHLLALNPDFYRLFAEVLGKKTGFSKGMGGSMHLFDQSSGFLWISAYSCGVQCHWLLELPWQQNCKRLGILVWHISVMVRWRKG